MPQRSGKKLRQLVGANPGPQFSQSAYSNIGACFSSFFLPAIASSGCTTSIHTRQDPGANAAKLSDSPLGQRDNCPWSILRPRGAIRTLSKRRESDLAALGRGTKGARRLGVRPQTGDHSHQPEATRAKLEILKQSSGRATGCLRANQTACEAFKRVTNRAGSPLWRCRVNALLSHVQTDGEFP